MRNQALLLRIAPLLFVSIWSTGFIAAKYSMHNADPFVFLCLRFSITALALVPIILYIGAALPRRLWTFRHDMVTGALLHCGYLGFLFWPIKNGVPAGIVAIIIGVQPILTMALASLYIGEQLDFRKARRIANWFCRHQRRHHRQVWFEPGPQRRSRSVRSRHVYSEPDVDGYRRFLPKEIL